MKPVILLNAPPSDPTQPYTSLPTLAAHLRDHDLQVIQRDLGIEALTKICTRAHLNRAWDRAQKLSCDQLDPQDRSEFRTRMLQASSFARHVIANVEKAAQCMRSSATFSDLRRYRWAVSVLMNATELASLPHHPTRLQPNGYEGKIDYSKTGVMQAVFDNRKNLFREMMARELVPSVLEQDPMLIGISITYHFQIVPGLTLASEIKRQNPRIPVVIGGAILARMEEHLKADPDWFAFADYFVVGEGESALLALVESIKYGTPLLNSVPNLLRRDKGITAFGDTCHTEDFASLPCPDYRGLDLEQYFSPEPVLLMPTTRGCYYGKCTFCDVSRQTRTVYRPISRSQVRDNILLLHQRHGAKRFFFCDDAVPMKNMREAASLVTESLPGITWQAEARLERPMDLPFMKEIHAGGCRQLIFGYESASQRVLDLMEKKNTVESDAAILEACANAGIAVNLQTFIGLPGETREEAESTIQYILEQKERIASIGFGVFSLYKDTPIYLEPEKHFVSNLSSPLAGNLLAAYDFTPTGGMSREDANQLHAQAIEKFRIAFATKSHLLGGASGAHSLLQLTYSSYEQLRHAWAEVDGMRSDPEWQSWRPVNAHLSVSSDDSATHAMGVFNETSARVAEVGAYEMELIASLDGRSSIDAIATQRSNSAPDETSALTEYYRAADVLRTLVIEEVVQLDRTSAALVPAP